MRPDAESVIKTLKSIKADNFSASRAAANEQFIQTIKKAGFGYHVWTVNDERTAQTFQRLQVNSITTDRPEAIRKAITEK